MQEYENFIFNKSTSIISSGFDISKKELNKNLYEFQKDIVRWALKKGKAAIFADCGLGKTIMQLEWANKVYEHTGKNVLILAPLAVSTQTKMEGKTFGIDVNICESQSDVVPGINITNYEKLDKFVANEFGGIVLDESSILKSFTGKIRNQIIKNFSHCPFRLACTATPAPNDYMELGNHAEFLGIMTRNEMLSMYFIHDGSDTSKWRLKGHADKIFWQWMASWCVFIDNPNSLGYEIEGYKLPKLNIFEIIADGTDFSNDKLTLTQRRNVRKETLNIRCQKAADIVNSSNEQWLIWCSLNDESAKLKEYINESYEVKGSDNSKYKAETMIKFSNNEIKSLVTKPSIAGFGMNWQQCNNMIFVGLSDSYEQYYQAIRRCWRFGQTKEVNVYIILSAKEGTVKENIARKEEDAKYMQSQMVELTKEITQKELHSTSRIVTEYIPKIEMILPKWEEMICKL